MRWKVVSDDGRTLVRGEYNDTWAFDGMTFSNDRGMSGVVKRSGRVRDLVLEYEKRTLHLPITVDQPVVKGSWLELPCGSVKMDLRAQFYD